MAKGNPPPSPPQGPTDGSGGGGLEGFLAAFPFVPRSLSFEPPHYENLSRLINSITLLLQLAHITKEDKELREQIFAVIGSIMMGFEEYYEDLKEGTVKAPFKLYVIDGGTKSKNPSPEGSPTKPVA